MLAATVVYRITERQEQRALVRLTSEPPAFSALRAEELDEPIGNETAGQQTPGTVWLWLVLLPLGLGAWVPLRLGIRVRNTLWCLLGATWSLITLAGWVVSAAAHKNSSSSSIGGLLVLLGWGAAGITTLIIRRRYIDQYSIARTRP